VLVDRFRRGVLVPVCEGRVIISRKAWLGARCQTCHRVECICGFTVVAGSIPAAVSTGAGALPAVRLEGPGAQSLSRPGIAANFLTHAVAAFDESLSSVGAADKAASYQRGFLDTLPAGDPLVRRPWSAGSRCTLDGSTPSPWAAPLFTRPLAFATRRKSGAPMSEVEGGM
jgi:hypothetical protein